MGEKYLIGEWVAFIQQIQYLVSRGYTEYCLINYPQKKTKKFLKIDEKIITKYNANLNKDKAYYNKKLKYCNFKFLRHEDTAILLKTNGNLKENIIMDDVFHDVQKDKICIRIGEKTNLMIGPDEEKAMTVFMDLDTYRDVKVTCFQYIDSKQYYKAINAFNNLNALPSWGGIVSQKIKMKEQIVKKMKKNMSPEQLAVLSKKMRINTKRNPVKVF